jgi:ankyrin repeat protein
MSKSLPTRALRENPDLDQLKRQAKELLEAYRSGDGAAITEVNAHYRGAGADTFALHDAQLVLARAYGFPSWSKLKAFVDGVTVRRLVDSISSGDLHSVQAMLKLRPELATMSLSEGDERQPLHFAVLARRADMTRFLMRHGADPRCGVYPHRDATSALTLATERGYNDVVEVIRQEERQSTRTLSSDHSRPPLPPEAMEALARHDQAWMIRFLEENPALQKVNFQHALMTPLHSATAMLWDDVIMWLLDHGADINARVDGGPSPLEIVGCGFQPLNATPEHIAAVVTLLRERGAQLTPRAAVAFGKSDWLRARHAEGKLPNGLPRNQGYRGLLEMAVTHNQPEVLELLLDLGFDPDEVLPMGDAGEFRRGEPLNLCVRTGRREMAETLIRRGATLTPQIAVLLGKADWLRDQRSAGKLENLIKEDGGLLSIAVQNNLPDMLELLLSFGLDPDERVRVENIEEVVYSAGGPLHHCASTGKIAMAETLLKHGANPNCHVYSAGPPMYKAYESRNGAMVELLERYGGVVDASTAGLLGLTDKARQLLNNEAAGTLPEGTHAPHWSAAEELLFYAADGGNSEIVQMALERISWEAADPRWHQMLVRNLGNHPEPSRRKHVECFRLILDRCDPSIPGTFGRTILHDLAADWPHPSPGPEERVEFARLVLTRNPRLDVRDSLLKSTPLGWACRWGRVELVKLLLECGADPIEADAEPWATPRAWAEKGSHDAAVNMVLARH